MELFTIYTDGSSRGNPGPGGWGVIVVGEKKVKEIGGREKQTTNNRMEMTAAIEGLKSLSEKVHVEIHTDSEYLMKGATLWSKGWIKNNWRTKDKKEVLNQDLWQALLFEIEKRNVGWEKVAGHSGHKYNDRCDVIATEFADGEPVKLYEGNKENYLV